MPGRRLPEDPVDVLVQQSAAALGDEEVWTAAQSEMNIAPFGVAAQGHEARRGQCAACLPYEVKLRTFIERHFGKFATVTAIRSRIPQWCCSSRLHGVRSLGGPLGLLLK